MNGSIPQDPGELNFAMPDKISVRVMETDEIEGRRHANVRLPRQILHIERLVDHILNVKDSQDLRRSLKAHYSRLTTYYDRFLEPN